MQTIGILHGPNLNLLGTRRPEVYGSTSLTDLETMVQTKAKELGYPTECYQSNHEGELIDTLQNWSKRGFFAAIINAGGYSHTSVALHDAIEAASFPTIEVHISNVFKRESFRHKSVIAGACAGSIAGLGLYGYEAALLYLAKEYGQPVADGVRPVVMVDNADCNVHR